MKPACIGITGSIGSGKSTVAQIIADITGWVPISLDRIGHEAYQDQQIRESILMHFGSSILMDDQTINRKKIGSLVFGSEMEKKWLENLLWPVIIQKTKKLVNIQKNCILDGVILFPSGLAEICRCVLVVKTRMALLKERAHDKGYSNALVDKILASQRSMISAKTEMDSIQIIQNNQSVEELVKSLTLLWEKKLRFFFETDKTTETKSSKDK